MRGHKKLLFFIIFQSHFPFFHSKITIDSLMTLDGDHIKSEVPIGGIASIAMENGSEDAVIMKFKVKTSMFTFQNITLFSSYRTRHSKKGWYVSKEGKW